MTSFTAAGHIYRLLNVEDNHLQSCLTTKLISKKKQERKKKRSPPLYHHHEKMKEEHYKEKKSTINISEGRASIRKPHIT